MKRDHALWWLCGIGLFSCLSAYAAPSFELNTQSDTTILRFHSSVVAGIAPANVSWTQDTAAINSLNMLQQPAVASALGVAAPQTQLTLDAQQSDALHIRYQQLHQGIPVLGKAVIAQYGTNQQLQQIVSHFDPTLNTSSNAGIAAGAPVLSAAQAIEAVQLYIQQQDALNNVTANDVALVGDPTLFWLGADFINLDSAAYQLAYQVDMRQADIQSVQIRQRYWVDANSGAILLNYPLQHSVRDRFTYDGNHAGDPRAFPDVAELKKDEQGNVDGYTGDDQALEAAHQFAGATYDYYFQRFGRDSYDAQGAPIHSYVHFANDYNNAFWDGTQMVYGDGDGQTFFPLSLSPNVVAHELTHAVTEHSANLQYFGPSGALNEAISDIMGKFAEAEQNGGVIDNWLLGDEIAGPAFPREAMRNLQDPTFGEAFDRFNPFAARNQPDHMDLFSTVSSDNYGVHINSGIVNKMAYLLVEGGTFKQITVSALGLALTEQLMYQTLTGYLSETSNFYDLVSGLRVACGNTDIVADEAACLASVDAAAQAVGLGLDVARLRTEVTLVEELQGDGDALLEAGERVKIHLLVHNMGAPREQVRLQVTSGDLHFMVDATTAVRELERLEHFSTLYAVSAEVDIVQDVPAGEFSSVNVVVTSSVDAQLNETVTTQFEHFGQLRYTQKENFVGAPIPFNMNDDAFQELSASLGVGMVRGLENPTSLLSNRQGLLTGWPSTFYDTTFRTTMGSIQGQPVVIVSGRYFIYVLNAQGERISAYRRNASVVPDLSSNAVIADVNGDGVEEILFINRRSYTDVSVHVTDINFNELPGWPLALLNATSLAVADMDQDGLAEIAVSAGKSLYLLSTDGQILPGWPKRDTDVSYASETMADLDGNGTVELIAATYTGVAAFNKDGSYATGFPVEFDRKQYDLSIRTIAVADLDGDDKMEIVSGYGLYGFFKAEPESQFGLFVFDYQGNVLPGWPNHQDFITYPILVNVDDDADIEIVAPSSYGSIKAWNYDGSMVEGFPLVADFAWNKSIQHLTAGDFDGDGDLDLAYSGPGTLKVLDLQVPYAPEKAPWPMFRQNAQSTAYIATAVTASCSTPSMFLRGTFNGWSGLAMDCVGFDEWAVTDLSLSASQNLLKFDVYNDWQENYGDFEPVDFIADLSGSDIAIGAGTYDIRFNYGSKHYSLKPKQQQGYQRTVVFIYGQTQSGEDMFIRGGIDHGYAANHLGKQCSDSNFECAIPIQHRNLLNATTAPWKSGDSYLDWYGHEASQSAEAEGSPLDWTTNSWPSDWGTVRTVEVDGYGLTPLNTFGMHYWMLDVDMDCSKTVNGWFELKSFIARGAGWERAINQSGTPYQSGNHFAQCGKLNVFMRNQNEPVTITTLP